MLLALGVITIGGGGCAQRVVADDPTEFGTTLAESDSSSTSTSIGGDDSTTGIQLPDVGGVGCPEECPVGATCFEGVCVGTGELRVSLSWNYVSDLDLHVETPTGVHISFENPAAGGGVLDVDDCIGGQCVDNAAVHVENIFFPQQPPVGEYRVWVNNFDGLSGGPFDIEVSGQATVDFHGEIPAAAVQSQVFTFGI